MHMSFHATLMKRNRCRQPVWLYDQAYRASIPFDEERDRPLMDKIATYLDVVGRSVVSE